MISFICKLCTLINLFSSPFDEPSIFKVLKHTNIYKRNGTETKIVITIIFSLVFHHTS